ncbi:MAG: PQQ-binding-like beta-propeller repeat protein [Anaerolineae bacterium]
MLKHHLFRNILTTLLLLAAVALSALIVASQWFPLAPAGAGPLARYAPVHDGSSSLTTSYDAQGTVLSWISTNLRVIPVELALGGDLPSAPRAEIEKFLRKPGETTVTDVEALARLASGEIYTSQSVQVTAAGALQRTEYLYLRDAVGDYLIALYSPGGNQALVFDPPALVLPSDVGPKRAWSTQGVWGNLDYVWRARVLDAKPFANELGKWNDCLLIETTTTYSRQAYKNESTDRSWYCESAGVVTSQEFAADGAMTAHSVTVPAGGVIPNVPAHVPAAATTFTPTQAVSSAWQLSTLARLGRIVDAGENTIPPTWIPTDPPLVLAASNDQDLVAYDLQGGGWRFHTGGVIFGPPAFDAARGRIYFGSSDKRLYAVDTRGLFLWAFSTGDNVAGRPVVMGGTVVFGSEDRNVYGVDADSGRMRWRMRTNGPVVSSPAASGSLVVIGSDDGTVYGIDVATPKLAWQFGTGGAVEAPVVMGEQVAYIASRDGNVYALDAASGQPIWSVNIGNRVVLRSAPALSADYLYVTDGDGQLTAIERRTGKIARRNSQAVYVGTPAVVGDAVIVSGADGRVYQLSLDLVSQSTWRATDEGAKFIFGPVSGGDALWLGDNLGYVRRLGRLTAPTALTSLWTHSNQAGNFTTTPALYQDQVIALDESNKLYRIDPLTGRAQDLAQLDNNPRTFKPAPVVAGNTLLTVINDKLYATDLRDGKLLWTFPGSGVSLFPVLVANDTVLWLTRSVALDNAPGVLQALNIATGAPRWTATLGVIPYTGGIVARNGIVYINTPPTAFDLATGKQLWASPLTGFGLGGPVLNTQGDELFSAFTDGAKMWILALAPRDGSIQWQAEIQQQRVSPFESLWVSGDLVIASLSGSAAGAGGVIAFDAASGQLRWRYASPVTRVGSLLVERGRVWFLLQDGQALALDAQTGKLSASYRDIEMNLDELGAFAHPVLLNGVLVAPQGYRVTGLAVTDQ